MEDDLRVILNKIQTPGLGFLIIPFLRDVLHTKNPTAKASSSDVSSIVFEDELRKGRLRQQALRLKDRRSALREVGEIRG